MVEKILRIDQSIYSLYVWVCIRMFMCVCVCVCATVEWIRMTGTYYIVYAFKHIVLNTMYDSFLPSKIDSYLQSIYKKKIHISFIYMRLVYNFSEKSFCTSETRITNGVLKEKKLFFILLSRNISTINAINWENKRRFNKINDTASSHFRRAEFSSV